MAERRVAKKIICSQEEEAILISWANDSKTNPKQALRAQIILECLKNETIAQVARNMKVYPGTVKKWRDRFAFKGLDGMRKPLLYGKPKTRILLLLEIDPTNLPLGQSCWEGEAVTLNLTISSPSVWQALRREGIKLGRKPSG